MIIYWVISKFNLCRSISKLLTLYGENRPPLWNGTYVFHHVTLFSKRVRFENQDKIYSKVFHTVKCDKKIRENNQNKWLLSFILTECVNAHTCNS